MFQAVGIVYKGQEERERRQVFLGPKTFHSSRMEYERVGVASQEFEETNLFKHRRS